MLCPVGLHSYSIDMWSVGCILAEMIGRTPLFPGKNFVHQLALIFDILGFPLPDELRHIKNSQAKKFLDSQVRKVGIPFSIFFACSNPSQPQPAYELLGGLLRFDPSKRLTADDALKSSYVTEIMQQQQHQHSGSSSGLSSGSSPSSSVSFSNAYPPTGASHSEFDFEKGMSSRSMLRSMIIRETTLIKRKQLNLQYVLGNNYK